AARSRSRRTRSTCWRGRAAWSGSTARAASSACRPRWPSPNARAGSRRSPSPKGPEMPDLSKTNNALVIASLALALLGSLGSVYLSMGLNLKACPLCYYQRTFIFAALGVLLIGVVYQAYEHVCLPALALPLALGGLGVAAFHISLELRGKMECP